MEKPGWAARPLAPSCSGGDDAWIRGFFHTTHENWTGAYFRDFDELQRRDLALFALGDVRGRTVLDVACGTGVYMVVLSLMGAEVAGQDLSPDSVQRAEEMLQRFGLKGTLRVGDGRRLMFEDASFDAVLSADFVEHISERVKQEFLAEVFRVLKPGGVLVVKTPNLSYLRLTVWLARLKALLKGRSPFRVHIAHTHNNPDNEHLGLTSYPGLRALLRREMFHEPQFIPAPLYREALPEPFRHLLPRLPAIGRAFCRDLIVRARKPLFLGFFP